MSASISTTITGRARIYRLGEVPLVDSSGPFHAYEFQVDRGDGWSESVTAYVAASGWLVAVRR